MLTLTTTVRILQALASVNNTGGAAGIDVFATATRPGTVARAVDFVLGRNRRLQQTAPCACRFRLGVTL